MDYYTIIFIFITVVLSLINMYISYLRDKEERKAIAALVNIGVHALALAIKEQQRNEKIILKNQEDNQQSHQIELPFVWAQDDLLLTDTLEQP